METTGGESGGPNRSWPSLCGIGRSVVWAKRFQKQTKIISVIKIPIAFLFFIFYLSFADGRVVKFF